MKARDRLVRVAAFTIALGSLGAWIGHAGSSPTVEVRRPAPVAAGHAAAPSGQDTPLAPIREAHGDGGYWYWLERQL